LKLLSAMNIACTVQGTPLLKPLSVNLQAGRVTAIVGPNGAGKSTLLSLLSGQRAASAGTVLLNGQSLPNWSPAALARVRAFMLQDSAVAFDYTVRDIVELGRYPHRQHRSSNLSLTQADIAQTAMVLTGVSHLAERVLNTLSGGEKARAQLARALAQLWETTPSSPSPRWLLLDEPTAALDLAHQHHVMHTVRQWAHEQDVGVVAVLHDLNLALRYADDVLVLQQAEKHSFGPVREVLTARLIQAVWGVACDAVTSFDGTPQYLFRSGCLALA
jgi:iron complex transport system ATP-binding protein